MCGLNHENPRDGTGGANMSHGWATLAAEFWQDEQGFVISAELILVSTLLVIGLITGLTCLQKAVNSELADVAGAIGSLNQSYCFSGFSASSPWCCKSRTTGSSFVDLDDGDRGDGPATFSGTTTVVPRTVAPATVIPEVSEPPQAIVPCPPAADAESSVPPAPILAPVPAVDVPVACPPATVSPSMTPAPVVTPCPDCTSSVVLPQVSLESVPTSVPQPRVSRPVLIYRGGNSSYAVPGSDYSGGGGVGCCQ